MRKRGNKTTVFFTVLILLLAFFGLVPVCAPLLSLSNTPRHNHHWHKSMCDRKFEIDQDMYWKEGKPYQIIGGDVHYFRILPEYWEDRLLRAKALGLNTIQICVPWNLHEPKPGKMVFEGFADLVSFLKLCQKLDLLVMLRPGHMYVEIENEFGSYGDDKAYLHHLVTLARAHLGDDVIL